MFAPSPTSTYTLPWTGNMSISALAGFPFCGALADERKGNEHKKTATVTVSIDLSVCEVLSTFVLSVRVLPRGSRKRFHGLQLYLVLGVHRFRTASGRFRRDSVFGWELVEKRVRPRQMVGHQAQRPVYFVYDLAGIRCKLLLRSANEIRCANERLGEIGRVENKDRHGKVISMAQEVCRYDGIRAARNSVSSDPTFFQVVGCNCESIPLPFPGGKSLPCVMRVGRGMRASIHVNCLLGRLPGDVGVISDEFLGLWVHLLPDSEQRRSSPRVVGGMWPALVLRQLQQSGNPRIPSEARRIVNGQSKIVADFGAGNSFRFVFVKTIFPFAARIGLGERRGT